MIKKIVRHCILWICFSMVCCAAGCNHPNRYLCCPRQNLSQTDQQAAEGYFYIGKQQYLNGDYISAAHFLIQALQKNPSEHRKADIFIYLGASYYYMPDKDTAMYYFEKAKRFRSGGLMPKANFPEELRRFIDNK